MGGQKWPQKLQNQFLAHNDLDIYGSHNFNICLDCRTNFSQGGVNIFTVDDNSTNDEKVVADFRNGFIGWAGLGGSIFQWHPELKIGFAFVPTCLHWFDVANLRGSRLQKIVVDCVKFRSE